MENNSEQSVNRWVDDRLGTLSPKADWEPNVSRGLVRFRELRAARGRRTRTLTCVAFGATATSLSLAAFPSTRAFTQRCVAVCIKESVRVSDLLRGSKSSPLPSAVYIQAANRQMAPEFELTDSSGKTVKLSDFRGKVVLLNFWATWCAPCKVEIPWFIEFQKTYRDQGFTVMGVSLDEDGWKSVKPFVDDRVVNYPVVIGDADVTRMYGGLEAMPTTLVIDRSGRIAAFHVGLCSKNEYEADIRTVLNE